MNKIAQLDFDMSDIFAIFLGICGGLLSLIVSKGSGAGMPWKVLTFAATTIVSFFVAKFFLDD
jgi:hypothetical protein